MVEGAGRSHWLSAAISTPVFGERAVASAPAACPLHRRSLLGEQSPSRRYAGEVDSGAARRIDSMTKITQRRSL